VKCGNLNESYEEVLKYIGEDPMEENFHTVCQSLKYGMISRFRLALD
jgi:hypothetical protein